MPPSFVTLTVPPDTQPGQAVQFQDPVTKQQLQVAVPPGVAPGATFQVQVASGTESSQSDVEKAYKTAQALAPVAAVLIKGAARASIAIGKAVIDGARYAHDKGYDKKAASVTSRAAFAGAKVLMGASIYDASMDAAFDGPMNKAANRSASGSAPAPPPASGTSSGVMYVIVPPDTGPGEQMLVLTPAGQQCLVQIPEGAAPGTQFAVQLP